MNSRNIIAKEEKLLLPLFQTNAISNYILNTYLILITLKPFTLIKGVSFCST